MRNWFVTPGWSTSWMALANRVAMISRSVNTACERQEFKKSHYKKIEIFDLSSSFLFFFKLTSKAGVDRRTCVDWTTSAAWMLLW